MNKAEKKSTRIFYNLLGYLVAVGSVALATWLKFLAQPNIIPADVPILYLLAIVPTAIFFGFGPALAVCVLSFLAYDYYFIPPIHQITFNITETPIVVIFLLVGVLFSYLASNLREKNRIAAREIAARKQSEAELIEYRDHLEELVQQRTSELGKANLELKDEITNHQKDEEALRQSEQRWAATLASIGDGVIATDVSGRINFVNGVAEHLTGWKQEEASNQPIAQVFNIINETTREKTENPVEKVLEKGIVCSLANHTILIRKDGSEISIDDSGAPIKNPNGITAGVVLVFRDITERRKTEKALRQMEERNRLLADILQHASQPFGIGLPDGSLGIVNKAFCELTGYSEEELRNMDWAKVLTPPEYQTMETEKLNELVRTGQPVRYQKEYVRKDNSRVPIELLVHLVRNADGQAEYYYSFLTDITQRKKAEEALRESEERFNKAFRSSPVAVAITKISDGTFIDVNDSYENLMGYTREEIVGSNPAELNIYIDHSQRDEIVRLINDNGKVRDKELTFRKKDGRLIDTICSFEVIRVRNQDFFLSTILDITERKKAEAALRESEAKANALIQYAPTGIYEIDYRTQRFLSINDAMSFLTGYTKEELFALGPGALLDEESKTLFAARIRRQLAGEKIDDAVEYRVRKKDGSTLWIALNIAFSNENPNVALVIGHDITGRVASENRLKESEERFFKTFASSPVPQTIAHLPDGRWIDVNDSFLRLMEFTREEVIGHTSNELKIFDQAERERVLKDIAKRGEVLNREVRVHSKTGKILTLLSSNSVIEINGEKHSVSTLVDITARKQAEAEIHRLNRELRAIWECSQAIAQANDEQALLDKVCRILHLTAGYHMAWIGSVEHDQNSSVKPIAWSGGGDYLLEAKITWADTERGRGPTGLAVRTGKTHFFQDFATEAAAAPWRQSALAHGYRSSIAIPLFDRGGAVFAVFTLYSTEPGYFDDAEVRLLEALAGDIAFGITALHDRVKRQQAEEETRQRTAELETVMNLVPVAIWVAHDPQCNNITGNRTANEFYEAEEGENVSAGPAPGEPIPSRRFFRNGKELTAEELPMQEAAARNMDIKGSEFNVILPNGKSRTLWGSATPLRDDDGKVRGVVAAFLDITEREKAEEELRRRTAELEAANKELEAFSYSVSHDLRAPLRSMAGFSNVMIEDHSDQLDAEGKSYLKKIQQSSEFMAQLIDDLLKLARIARSEMKYEKLNLSELAAQVTGELQTANPTAKVKISIEKGLTGYGDPILIHRVLDNLLGNAWKFSSKTREPRIEVGTVNYKGKQAYFVRDNGAGFDMTYLDKLFKPFQRLHTSSEFSGTGIGLAIVQRIILRHGGEVWAEGKVGEGATFYFTLTK